MPIRDQSQYRKLESELKSLRFIRRIRPLLYLFGPKGWKAAREIGKLPSLEADLRRLRNIPDQFNDLFRNAGWIATDDMNLTAMEEAIHIRIDRDLETAGSFLENHYNSELDSYLRRLWFVPRVKPRRHLIELALEDHKAGRYHASVPVILAQIDGIAFDLVQKSFYKRGERETRHLRANETTVGDPTGLPALAALLSESRSETTDVPISLPFRHGILHGRDLGYATRRVSTKAFAMLLALRPWILAVDRGEQFKVPERFFDPETATWDETKAQWEELWSTLQEHPRRDKDR